MERPLGARDFPGLLLLLLGVLLGLAALPPLPTRAQTPPGKPRLVQPQTGQAGQPAPAVSSCAPTLEWSPVAGATSYEVKLGFEPTFIDPARLVVSERVTQTRYSVRQLAPGGTYYWQVRAYNGNVASVAPDVWNFRTPACGGTDPGPPSPPAPTPSDVSLTSFSVPSSGTAGTAFTVTVRAVNRGATARGGITLSFPDGLGVVDATSNAGCAAAYPRGASISRFNSDGTTTPIAAQYPLVDCTLSWANGREISLSATVQANQAGRYTVYVRATALNDAGLDNSPLDGPRDQQNLPVRTGSVTLSGVPDTATPPPTVPPPRPPTTVPPTTVPIPAAPELVVPSNAASVDTPTPLLQWKGDVNTAYYILQVATDTAFFGSGVIINTRVDSVTYTLAGGLSEGKTYYWHVAALNRNDASGPWSATYSFKYDPKPGPKLGSPADRAERQELKPKLEWESLAGARSYKLQVATEANFFSPLVNVDVPDERTPRRTYSVDGELQRGTRYFWHVAAVDGQNVSTGWSVTYSFVTLPEPGPELGEPKAQASDQPVKPTLRWQPAKRAARYVVQVANEPQFINPLINENTAQSEFTWAKDLEPGQTYYWHVAAITADDISSEWSPTGEFKTRSAAVSPNGGAPSGPGPTGPSGSGGLDLGKSPWLLGLGGGLGALLLLALGAIVLARRGRQRQPPVPVGPAVMAPPPLPGRPAGMTRDELASVATAPYKPAAPSQAVEVLTPPPTPIPVTPTPPPTPTPSNGVPRQALGPLAMGDWLAGQYELRGYLGGGGMADVYRAWDHQRDIEVAVKVIKDEIAEDTEYVQRFQREVRALTELQHPHIVRCYGQGQHGDTPFLVLEYAVGGSLRDRLRPGHTSRPLLTVATATQVTTQIGRALSYAHRRGYIHRDIKPGNILFAEPDSWRALLSDLGIVKSEGGVTLTHTGVRIGTLAYMAPEQSDPHQPFDQRADLYALGVTLYEMLAGRRPFTGERSTVSGTSRERLRDEQLHWPPPPLRPLNPAVPPALEEIVFIALAVDPVERWQSADALVRALEACDLTAP